MKSAVNEFNQVMKPVSLWADAWKRLRKNKMALVSLYVVSFYILITISAPLLTSLGVIHSNREQVIYNATLPPSFKPAGELVLDKLEKRIVALEETIAEQAKYKPDIGFNSATGYSFSFDTSTPPAEGQAEGPAAEAPAAEADMGFSLNFGGVGTDTTASSNPLVRELEFQRSALERLKAEVDTNPDYKKVYIFGTDDLGRDMLARIIYGGRISLAIGVVGTLTAAFVGILIGAVSGYIGGWLDNLIMRFVDIMYGLPYMLIVIIIMAMIGEKARGSFVILFIAIALVSWLTIARVVRGQIISLKNSEFVEAARSMGASVPRIIFRHLLPNTLGVIVVFSTLLMPSFIMNESFLSFLGLGVSAPAASWGTLVSEGVKAMEFSTWQLLGPAIAMTIFLFCMNFLGDGLRDALDPQSKNRT
ncbi:MAG: oligopeptide transport system permease protein [Spirochaetes bacterium]|nr:MAG: oligopeptide transport system permease protein [Spirochaetota bacterium]